MKNLTLSPPLNFEVAGEEKYIHQFFENYPPALIEERIWGFCKSKVLSSTAIEVDTLVESVTFYEGLIYIISNLRRLVNQYDLPCLIAPSFTEQTLVSVEGVVNLIKQAIPVGVIYNLSKVKEELDLIIVLEKSCARAYNEFESIIDLATLGYQQGTCTVHNYGLLNTLMSKGHIFYATACIEENVVYRKSTDEVFPVADPEQVEITKAMVSRLFKGGMEKAENFYDGAQHYFNDGENEMAIFMLQQTCELTYRCLLNVLRGKDLKCHSPAILRKHLKRFAPEIIGVFSMNEAAELEYLQVLEEAYVKSRYQPNYKIDQELIGLLNDKVGLLQERAFELFEKRMAIFGGLP